MLNSKFVSPETEIAIRKACDSIACKNQADLLIELWNRNLISDNVFTRRLTQITGILISLD